MCKHWIARGLLALLGFGALLWLSLQSTVLAEVKEEGFVSLFNGKDLTGWEGKPGLWRVRDGMLVGDSLGIRENILGIIYERPENGGSPYGGIQSY